MVAQMEASEVNLEVSLVDVMAGVMEEEAAKLKEMQQEVEKQMASGGAASANATDDTSIYVGQVGVHALWRATITYSLGHSPPLLPSLAAAEEKASSSSPSWSSVVVHAAG